MGVLMNHNRLSGIGSDSSLVWELNARLVFWKYLIWMSATFMVLTQEVPILYVEMSYLNLKFLLLYLEDAFLRTYASYWFFFC